MEKNPINDYRAPFSGTLRVPLTFRETHGAHKVTAIIIRLIGALLSVALTTGSIKAPTILFIYHLIEFKPFVYLSLITLGKTWPSEAILLTHLLRFLRTELPESSPLLFMCTPSLCASRMLCRPIPALSGFTCSVQAHMHATPTPT